MWIGIREKLMMYRVPPYPIKGYSQGFGYICISFMMIKIIIPKKGLSLSHRKQYYSPSDVRVMNYLMYFECYLCEFSGG